MKYILVLATVLMLCGCGRASKRKSCDEACELKKRVQLLQMQKLTQRKKIHALSAQLKRFEEKRDNVCEKCYCRKHELTMDDCHPMGTDNDWNVAIRGGMPGDGIIPYMCSSIGGSPINKYPPAYRQLWHVRANRCILRVDDLINDPKGGRLAYRIDGVNADIFWKAPALEKWVPKGRQKQTH